MKINIVMVEPEIPQNTGNIARTCAATGGKLHLVEPLGYSDVEYEKFDEVFLLFGKETKGLPEDLLKKYLDKTIRIPMRSMLRSLNLSNSVAIVIYEVLRHKNFENLEETSEYFNK